MNLLRMAQLIASSMDSDEFSDIDDSIESRQIVDLIEQTYNDIVSQIEFPEHYNLFELEPSNDMTQPVLMTLPDHIDKVEWLKYNKKLHTDLQDDWHPLLPMERGRFFQRMRGLEIDKPEVSKSVFKVGPQTFDLYFWNDRPPTYYTTVDNRTLIFDSFDREVSATLLGNYTMGYGQTVRRFVRENTWVPDLEPRQLTLFFNEAKSLCFAELKQIQNAKAEQRARRGWTQAARKKNSTKASRIRNDLPNYGRKGKR